MIHLVLKQHQNYTNFISLSIAPATIMMGVSFHLSKRYGSRLNGMMIILSGIIVLLGMVYASTMIEDLKPSLVDSSVEMVPIIFIGVSIPVIIFGTKLLKTRPRKPKKNYLEDGDSFLRRSSFSYLNFDLPLDFAVV